MPGGGQFNDTMSLKSIDISTKDGKLEMYHRRAAFAAKARSVIESKFPKLNLETTTARSVRSPGELTDEGAPALKGQPP